MPTIARVLPLVIGGLSALGGCSVDTFRNQTASRGGGMAGEQGSLDVIFINNTPFRAIFTSGTYNNTDQFAVPATEQFAAGTTTLEGGTFANAIILPCDRVFSVGDSELLRLINENLTADALDALDDQALVLGAGFSDADLGEDNDDVATQGFAPPIRALLGVDFPCGSILVIRFEEDPAGDAPFRADFEVIPTADSDRGL